ncbi:porin family protein [Vibrio comitans]
MKKILLASTLVLLSAPSFAANDSSGFRVGGGFGTDFGNHQLRESRRGPSVEADPTVVLEAGYDFNDIFAINVKGSATGNKIYGNSRRDRGKSYNLGTTYDLAVEAEAGYTFKLDRSTSIKPYLAVGAVGYDKDTTEYFQFEDDKDKNGIKARGALGVRMTLGNGVYVDGRVQATDFSPKGGDFNAKDDLLTQGLLTVGYKF